MKNNIKNIQYKLFYILFTYFVFYGVFRKIYNTNIYFFIPPIFVLIFIVLSFKYKYSKKFIFIFLFLIIYPILFLPLSIFQNYYLIFVVFLNYIVYQFIALNGYSLSFNEKYIINLFQYISKLSVIISIFGLIQFKFHDQINLPIMFTLSNEKHLIGHSFGDMNIFWITSFFDVAPKMDSFLVFAFFINLFLAKRLNKNKFNFINIFLVLPTIMLSGHRTPAVILIFILIVLQKFNIKFFIYIFFLMIITLIMALYFIPDLMFFLLAFYYAKDRLWWMFADFFCSLKSIGLIGYGAGFSSQGIQYIPGYEKLKEIIHNKIQFIINSEEYSRGYAYFQGIESGLAKLIVEFGLLGAILYLSILIFLIFYPYFKLNKINSHYIYLSGYPLVIFLWSLLVHHQIMGEFITLTLFYLVIGIQWGIISQKRQKNANL